MKKKIYIVSFISILTLASCARVDYFTMPIGGTSLNLANYKERKEAQDYLCVCLDNTFNSLNEAIQLDLEVKNLNGKYRDYTENGYNYAYQYSQESGQTNHYFYSEVNDFCVDVRNLNLKLSVGMDSFMGNLDKCAAFVSIKDLNGKVSYLDSTKYIGDADDLTYFNNNDYNLVNDEKSWSISANKVKAAAYLSEGDVYADLSNDNVASFIGDVASAINPEISGVVKAGVATIKNETNGYAKLNISNLLSDTCLVPSFDQIYINELIYRLRFLFQSDASRYLRYADEFINFKKYSNGTFAFEIDLNREIVKEIIRSVAQNLCDNQNDIEAEYEYLKNTIFTLFPENTNLHIVFKSDKFERVKTIAIDVETKYLNNSEETKIYHDAQEERSCVTSKEISADGQVILNVKYGKLDSFPDFSKYKESTILNSLLEN